MCSVHFSDVGVGSTHFGYFACRVGFHCDSSVSAVNSGFIILVFASCHPVIPIRGSFVCLICLFGVLVVGVVVFGLVGLRDQMLFRVP